MWPLIDNKYYDSYDFVEKIKIAPDYNENYSNDINPKHAKVKFNKTVKYSVDEVQQLYYNVHSIESPFSNLFKSITFNKVRYPFHIKAIKEIVKTNNLNKNLLEALDKLPIQEYKHKLIDIIRKNEFIYLTAAYEYGYVIVINKHPSYFCKIVNIANNEIIELEIRNQYMSQFMQLPMVDDIAIVNTQKKIYSVISEYELLFDDDVAFHKKLYKHVLGFGVQDVSLKMFQCLAYIYTSYDFQETNNCYIVRSSPALYKLVKDQTIYAKHSFINYYPFYNPSMYSLDEELPIPYKLKLELA